MATKVFLSLSYVDAEFVADVRRRLPHGLAYFYQDSFDNGEQLLSAMRKRVQEARLFVLFVSPEGLASNAVKFEMAEAEQKIAFDPEARLLLFPTRPEVTFRDLPVWMQRYWTAQAGYSASDIARYITTYLLAPNEGISAAATKVVGRGKTSDKLDEISADYLQRKKESPNIYVLAGFTGIGRRTFASYYMRTALATDANLAFGPVIALAAQADAVDLYRELRGAIDDRISPADLRRDQAIFSKMKLELQVDELIRLLGHFASLKQAVTLASTSGFFEESGEPKSWVATLLLNMPRDFIVFLITNRQFSIEFLEGVPGAVQMRVGELSDSDTKTLMIETANKMSVPDFAVPEEMIRAIGGHADVAKAAVRLASQRGLHALTQNPAYLYNVQRTILGETIDDGALSEVDHAILGTLCWVPALGGDILQEIVCRAAGIDETAFTDACQQLVLGCLVTTQGYGFAIAAAIRQLYRRWHVTPPATLETIGTVLASHWKTAESEGTFREDLFEAFVFMHAFKGEKLPVELKGLLSPGTLESVVSETYARGKNEDDSALLEQAISWGDIAETMDMSESVREEILGTVARAKIRLGQWAAAQQTIDRMCEAGYTSYHFLQGHLYRRHGDLSQAMTFLETAADKRKLKRSAVHELALTYSKLGRDEKLDGLLEREKILMADSAMFLDFAIGQKFKRDDLSGVEAMIRRLRTMADDDGRSERREAHLLIREGRSKEAIDQLTNLIDARPTGQFHLRSLRSIAASKDKNFALAKRDIDFIRNLRGREDVASRLDAEYHCEARDAVKAEEALRQVESWTNQDWRLYARILEGRLETTDSLSEREKLGREIDTIRARYGAGSHLEF